MYNYCFATSTIVSDTADSGVLPLKLVHDSYVSVYLGKLCLLDLHACIYAQAASDQSVADGPVNIYQA